MTTLGLVGGLGPESTIDYYRRLNLALDRHRQSRCSARLAPGGFGVILGGTELPLLLLLQAKTIAGIPVLDTTALHVAAIVARLQL